MRAGTPSGNGATAARMPGQQSIYDPTRALGILKRSAERAGFPPVPGAESAMDAVHQVPGRHRQHRQHRQSPATRRGDRGSAGRTYRMRTGLGLKRGFGSRRPAGSLPSRSTYRPRAVNMALANGSGSPMPCCRGASGTPATGRRQSGGGEGGPPCCLPDDHARSHSAATVQQGRQRADAPPA